MRVLRTNTAVRISVGPFLDYEEGTPETALTVTNTICEMVITPNDGGAVTRTAITLTASGGSNDMVHIADDIGGYYDLELTQAQTNFLGRMRLAFTDADVHMSLWEDFIVVPNNVFDALVLGTDYLDTSVVEQANIDFGATQKASINTEVDTALNTVIPALPTEHSINERVKTLDDLISSSKLPAQVKGTDDIDFSATQKTSLNASTPASIQGAVASVTNDVGITQAGADKAWGTAVRALTDKAGFSLSTAGIKAIWDQLTSALTAVGSIGKKLSDWVLGTDDKVILSANAQTGVTIPTVTAVTNSVTITSNADITSILTDTNEIQGKLPTNYIMGSSVLTAKDGAIDNIETDTNQIQGLISDSKMASQVKGMDADVISASALKADAVNEITAAIWAKVVDGTITFEKMSKILLAFTAGKVIITSNSFAFYDQSNALLFTLPITLSGRVPVVA